MGSIDPKSFAKVRTIPESANFLMLKNFPREIFSGYRAIGAGKGGKGAIGAGKGGEF